MPEPVAAAPDEIQRSRFAGRRLPHRSGNGIVRSSARWLRAPHESRAGLLAGLDYDFDRLGTLMATCDWTTVQLIWRETSDTYHARDPFPPGGVVEDPATGAAAAAFGAYLRELGLVEPPARITIHQGEDLGRPSRLTIEIPPGAGTGIRVSGRAVQIG